MQWHIHFWRKDFPFQIFKEFLKVQALKDQQVREGKSKTAFSVASKFVKGVMIEVIGCLNTENNYRKCFVKMNYFIFWPNFNSKAMETDHCTRWKLWRYPNKIKKQHYQLLFERDITSTLCKRQEMLMAFSHSQETSSTPVNNCKHQRSIKPKTQNKNTNLFVHSSSKSRK